MSKKETKGYTVYFGCRFCGEEAGYLNPSQEILNKYKNKKCFRCGMACYLQEVVTEEERIRRRTIQKETGIRWDKWDKQEAEAREKKENEYTEFLWSPGKVIETDINKHSQYIARLVEYQNKIWKRLNESKI